MRGENNLGNWGAAWENELNFVSACHHDQRLIQSLTVQGPIERTNTRYNAMLWRRKYLSRKMTMALLKGRPFLLTALCVFAEVARDSPSQFNQFIRCDIYSLLTIIGITHSLVVFANIDVERFRILFLRWSESSSTNWPETKTRRPSEDDEMTKSKKQ